MPMVLPSGQNIRFINRFSEEQCRNNEHRCLGTGLGARPPGYAGSQASTAATMTETSPWSLEMLRYTQSGWL